MSIDRLRDSNVEPARLRELTSDEGAEVFWRFAPTTSLGTADKNEARCFVRRCRGSLCFGLGLSRDIQLQTSQDPCEGWTLKGHTKLSAADVCTASKVLPQVAELRECSRRFPTVNSAQFELHHESSSLAHACRLLNSRIGSG